MTPFILKDSLVFLILINSLKLKIMENYRLTNISQENDYVI